MSFRKPDYGAINLTKKQINKFNELSRKSFEGEGFIVDKEWQEYHKNTRFFYNACGNIYEFKEHINIPDPDITPKKGRPVPRQYITNFKRVLWRDKSDLVIKC